MAKYLFEARLKLNDGTVLFGPVTVNEENDYLFVQKSSALDVYFRLTEAGGLWVFAGGPSITPPQGYIDQIGEQIDAFNAQKERSNNKT